MLVGPRNSLVASLLGKDYDPLTDMSHWVVIGPQTGPEYETNTPSFG